MPVRAQLGIEELHRDSLDEYHRSIEAGGFDEDERVELLDGLLVEMRPKSPRHERAVRWLARWLMLSVADDVYEVGVASPLTLAVSPSTGCSTWRARGWSRTGTPLRAATRSGSRCAGVSA